MDNPTKVLLTGVAVFVPIAASRYRYNRRLARSRERAFDPGASCPPGLEILSVIRLRLICGRRQA